MIRRVISVKASYSQINTARMTGRKDNKNYQAKLLADNNDMRGNLMFKALNYLNSFWNQLILYLKDGRYNIDNSLAECTLRLMTVERKNSLTYGSHDGARNISCLLYVYQDV